MALSFVNSDNMMACTVEGCNDEVLFQYLYGPFGVKYYCNAHYDQYRNGDGKPYDQDRIKKILMPALEAYMGKLKLLQVEIVKSLMEVIVYVETLMSKVNKKISKDKYEIEVFIDTIRQWNPQLNEYYKILLFKDEDELKEYLKLDFCYPKFTCEVDSIFLSIAQTVHLFDGSLINLHKDSDTIIIDLLDYLPDIPEHLNKIPLYVEVTEKAFTGKSINEATLDISKNLSDNAFVITIGESGIFLEDQITQVPYGQIYKHDTFYQGEIYANHPNGFGSIMKEPEKSLYTGFYYEGWLRGMFIIDPNDGNSAKVGFNYGNGMRRSDPISLILQSNYIRSKVKIVV